MERVGLVSQVEAELEKMLALGLLPPDGKFPSEHGLARCFGVSRGTVREAIRSLTTRGLVVPYPGRRTRVVGWDQALNLETLSVALTGDGRLMPGRSQLLEGFLALKREITVDLLVACCEEGSAADLDLLSQACFGLEDAARWDTGERKWVWQEFDLLKQAACTAERMGHLLLIQSLERTFKGMAKWALPHLNPRAVQSWARCAMEALEAKNVQALRHQLPPLLQAVEEPLLRSLAPAHLPTKPQHPQSEVAKEGAVESVTPNLSNNRTGLCEVATEEETEVEEVEETEETEVAEAEAADPVTPNLSNNRTGLCEVAPTEAPSFVTVSAGAGHEPEPAAPAQAWSPGAEEDGEEGTHPPDGPPWAKPPGRVSAQRWMPPTMGLMMPLVDPE